MSIKSELDKLGVTDAVRKLLKARYEVRPHTPSERRASASLICLHDLEDDPAEAAWLNFWGSQTRHQHFIEATDVYVCAKGDFLAGWEAGRRDLIERTKVPSNPPLQCGSLRTRSDAEVEPVLYPDPD